MAECYLCGQDSQNKIDKTKPAAANNVALLNADGNLVDSGKQLTPEGIGADPVGTGLYSSFTNIPENADLNDYTACGYYACGSYSTAQTITNIPFKDAFCLIVYNSTGNADDTGVISGKAWRYRLQRFISYTGDAYVRSVHTNGSSTVTFGNWHKFACTTDTVAAANAVVDYNKADKHIKIGWNGDSLKSGNLKYLAGYDSTGNIKDVDTAAVVSKLFPYYGFFSDGGLILSNQDTLNVVYPPSVIRFGTWTPVIAGASSHSKQSGWYLTIGGTCIIGWYAYGTFAGSTTTRFSIQGCPFTPLEVSGGGGGCSGYTSANNIIFTGYEIQKNANIYAVGQETSTSSTNRWQSNNIYQKASGDTSSYGTIAFKITPVSD